MRWCVRACVRVCVAAFLFLCMCLGVSLYELLFCIHTCVSLFNKSLTCRCEHQRNNNDSSHDVVHCLAVEKKISEYIILFVCAHYLNPE